MVADLTLSADPRLMKVVRAVINFFAQQVGFGDAEAMNLMLAVDEACTNIIRHTYGGNTSKSIAMRVESLPDRIQVVLEDTGPPMPEGALRPRELRHEVGELKPGGLGTFFITSIMDRVVYDSEPGRGNRLTMVKHRAKEPKV